MSDIKFTVERLNELQPLDIVTDSAVRDRFIQIYDTLWGAGTGEAAYERESRYFNHLLREADGGKLQKATKFSIFNAFIELAVSGLTIEPRSRALCYLTGRNVNVGTKEHQRWEGRCVLTISGYGELVLRVRAGQIRHADNPVLVYENDEFSFADRDGRKSVEYVAHYPHTGKRIVACYLGITRADGSRDYGILFEEDWHRLAGFSAKQNSKNIPNSLYGYRGEGAPLDIDPGFLCAKCIKHAFKSYPKVRIGSRTVLETDIADTPEGERQLGIGETPATEAPAMRHQESFAPEPDTAAGVTVETDEEDGF